MLPEGFGKTDPVDSMREKARVVREQPLTPEQITRVLEQEHVGNHLHGEAGTRRSARVR